MTHTGPPRETRALSAATHECPGGCGEELPSRLFACTKCWRRLPHDLRQELIRTRPRKYLDAERLQAIHEAEDYLEAIAETGEPPPPPPAPALGDAITKATNAALDKADYNDMLGKKCAIEYAQRKGQIPNLPQLPTKHRGKR